MVTGAQLRAARGLLDWTRADLARIAGVSQETVKNIEHGTFRPQEATTAAILRSFALRDIEFTEDEGVRRRRDSIVRFEGPEGFKRFMDDVYETSKAMSDDPTGETNKPLCLSCVNDKFFREYLGDFVPFHVKRMNALKRIKMHILLQGAPTIHIPEEGGGTGYRAYRGHPMESAGNTPFYLYGDKLGIIIFEGKNAPHIILINSIPVARAYREQFDIMWGAAKPFSKTRDK